jgi:hypothetical protein
MVTRCPGLFLGDEGKCSGVRCGGGRGRGQEGAFSLKLFENRLALCWDPRQKAHATIQKVIQEQMLRIMRERISDCARKSGVFARTKCQDVVQEYRAALDEIQQVRGEGCCATLIYGFLSRSGCTVCQGGRLVERWEAGELCSFTTCTLFQLAFSHSLPTPPRPRSTARAFSSRMRPRLPPSTERLEALPHAPHKVWTFRQASFDSSGDERQLPRAPAHSPWRPSFSVSVILHPRPSDRPQAFLFVVYLCRRWDCAATATKITRSRCCAYFDTEWHRSLK